MSQFQDALHAFVRASSAAANIECHRRTDGHQERHDRVLAAAGDRLESVLRQMMNDEAVKAFLNLNARD